DGACVGRAGVFLGISQRPTPELDHVVGPLLKEESILLGDAEQLGDHDGWEGLGEVGDNIHAAGPLYAVEQLIHNPLDDGPEILQEGWRKPAIPEDAK